MILGDALEWLDRHVNLEQITRGEAGLYAQPDRERIRTLSAAMADPQNDYPVIQVTGTNGKGSTSLIIAALLAAQGISTGIMTSPQRRLNERIATDLGPLTDAELIALIEQMQHTEAFVRERSPALAPPSWFEVVTAAGYRHFSDAAVEAAVVEVGVGGRFDATSVADAAVAVVTNVELDHTEILGPDRESIAHEKAGIIKEDAAVVVGELDDEIVAIFTAEARDVGAEALWRRGIDYDWVDSRIAVGGRLLDLRTPAAQYEGVYLPLFGVHQAANAATALAAAEAFFGVPLEQGVVEEAFASVTNPGRLEVVSRHPLVILDGAHNEAGAASLGRALEEDFSTVEGFIVVLGVLVGRDPYALLEAIGTGRIRKVIATAPESRRAVPAAAVAEAAEAADLPFEVVADVHSAVEHGASEVGERDGVVVAGSLYVVWEARQALSGSVAGP